LLDKIKDLPDNPYQPSNFSFPVRVFGATTQVNRSFQASWFNRFHWLHYDAALDIAFCFVCCKASKMKRVLLTGVTEHTFIVKGFSNWKDAIRAFNKHEASDLHKLAVDSLKCRIDIGEMLSSQHAKEKKINRDYLMKVLSSIRFLARQGLALRGDYDEVDSNLYQLLLLRAEDDPMITSALEKRKKFTSHDIQNEMISMMAHEILRTKAHRIHSKYFAIMIDEATDVSNSEQVVFELRLFDYDLSIYEHLIRLYKT